MIELGKYTTTILSAWGVTFLLVGLLILLTWRQSVKARRALDAAEARRSDRHG